MVALPFILSIVLHTLSEVTSAEMTKESFKSPFTEINSGCKDLAVGLVYRSLVGSVPSFMKILEEVVDSVQKHPCELILMGDFILNLLDQNSASAIVFFVNDAFFGNSTFSLYTNPSY